MSFLAAQRRRGFTLVELLTVIAIIGILSAITFGVVKGVNERAAVGQAKAELATLAQALEAYKRQYGDYPQAGSTNSSAALAANNAQYYLFNALAGVIGPKCKTGSDDLLKGKSFVDMAQFSLYDSKATPPAPGSGTLVTNAFSDPWGRQYWYVYKAAGSTGDWKVTGYLLFSAGPDGTVVTDEKVFKDGIMTSAFKSLMNGSSKGNLDNIYANE